MPRNREYRFYVYIIASAARVLYTGMTNNLLKRVSEHKAHRFEGFTDHFHHCRLVYYEVYSDVGKAIAREKQIKRWRREKKIWLIERANRDWKDLSEAWLSEHGPSTPLRFARDDSQS